MLPKHTLVQLSCLIMFTVLLPAVSIGAPGWLKDRAKAAEGRVFHEEAPAAYLYRYTEIEIKDDGPAKAKARLAVKVLSNDGIQHAVLEQLLVTSREIKKVEGWLVGPDGHSEDLKDDYVFERGRWDNPGSYDDDRILVAVFPDVRVGDVVGFEWEVEYNALWDRVFHDFRFQTQIPVVEAEFRLKLPDHWDLHTGSRFLKPVHYSRDGSEYIWRAENLAYRPDEPYMPPWQWLARWLAVSIFDTREAEQGISRDWRSVARWVRSVHDSAIVPDKQVRATVERITADATTPGEQLEAIASFVRDDIRYVAVEIEEGRFQPRPAAVTLRNRYGDCKDKVTLMRSMLEVAGFESEPVLTSVYQWLDPMLPSPFQFNHCIVAVPPTPEFVEDSLAEARIDNWLYFDPTAESIPLGRLPRSLHGAPALRVTEDAYPIYLNSLEPEKYRTRYEADATVDESGNVTADVTVTGYAYRSLTLKHVSSGDALKDWLESWREQFSTIMRSPSIADPASGADGDSAWIRFTVTGEYDVATAGPMRLLKADPFNPDKLEKLTTDDRVHPIWLGSDRMEHVTVRWHFPASWQADPAPLNYTDSCTAAMFTAATDIADSVVTYTNDLTYFGRVMDPEHAYQAARFLNELTRAYATRLTFTVGK